MGKRIAIATLAIVVLGVLAYVLSQPKKGTVEYHKQKYLKAWNRYNEQDWRSRLGYWLMERKLVTTQPFGPDGNESDSLSQEIASHRNALVRLGYLSERMIIFTNMSVEKGLSFSTLTNWPPVTDLRWVEFFFNRSNETNSIVVVAPASSVQLWEDFLRKRDVPENRE